jgi:hypothetical protein
MIWISCGGWPLVIVQMSLGYLRSVGCVWALPVESGARGAGAPSCPRGQGTGTWVAWASAAPGLWLKDKRQQALNDLRGEPVREEEKRRWGAGRKDRGGEEREEQEEKSKGKRRFGRWGRCERLRQEVEKQAQEITKKIKRGWTRSERWQKINVT